MRTSIKSNHSYTYNELMGILPWIPSGPVLDAGCGPGTIAVALANYGFSVTALDVSSENIERNYKKYGDLVDWQISDIRNFALEEKHYSVIFCLNVLPFIPNEERKSLIQQLKKSLKPGGIMVLSGFNEQDPAKSAFFARKKGSPKPLPTGIIEKDELIKHFPGWEVWHNFAGLVEDNHEPIGFHYHGSSEIIVRKPEKNNKKEINWLQLPTLGVGSGWRNSLKKFLNEPGNVDFIEVMLDEYFDLMKDSDLLNLVNRFQVVPHGVELSVGSAFGIT